MTITKILIGIDDSKYAEHAASYGFDIARKFNAEVAIVNIVETIVFPQMAAGSDPVMGIPVVGTGMEELEIMDLQKNRSEDMINLTEGKFAEGIKVTHFTEYGSTADGIINCAKEYGADLIVIGTHNRSGLDRLLAGNVAEQIIRHATVPVLVVPFGS